MRKCLRVDAHKSSTSVKHFSFENMQKENILHTARWSEFVKIKNKQSKLNLLTIVFFDNM